MRKRWTKEEDDLLRLLFDHMSHVEMAKELNRPLGSVRNRTIKLGLSLFGNDSTKRKRAISRFFNRVEKVKSGCWEWQHTTINDGYGIMGYLGKPVLAHRFSWELHNGPILDGAQVNHTCDNRLCCNPDHLWLGTQKENIADMLQKGRGYAQNKSSTPDRRFTKRVKKKSVASPVIRKTVLSASQVAEIKIALREGIKTQTAIAKVYGVSKTTIHFINIGRTWRHIK